MSTQSETLDAGDHATCARWVGENLGFAESAPTIAPATTSPLVSRMTILLRYVEGEVSNGNVMEFYEGLGEMEPSQRADALRERAASAGIEDCDLASILDRESVE